MYFLQTALEEISSCWPLPNPFHPKVEPRYPSCQARVSAIAIGLVFAVWLLPVKSTQATLISFSSSIEFSGGTSPAGSPPG